MSSEETSTELAQPRVWRMHITIDEMPITTPAQSQEIQQTLAALAIDRQMEASFAGRVGTFEFTLLMQAERMTNAAFLFESTMVAMCSEMTGRTPRMSSFTGDNVGNA